MDWRMFLKLSIVCAIICVVLILIILLRIRLIEDVSDVKFLELDSVPSEYWQSLSEKRIFFGHQSIGQDIILGVEEILRAHPEIPINVLEMIDSRPVNEAAIYHKRIGRNTRPQSKINSFRNVMDSNTNPQFDIALMKFCYVDITSSSVPEEVFEHYERSLSALHEKYPETSFLHATVPIESVPRTLAGRFKGLVKEVVRAPGVLEDNASRQRFNELIRRRHGGGDALFDIALCEAVGPNGRLNYKLLGNDKIYFMDAAYSEEDGGHLGPEGRVRVGEQFLMTLACAAHDRDEMIKSSGRP